MTYRIREHWANEALFAISSPGAATIQDDKALRARQHTLRGTLLCISQLSPFKMNNEGHSIPASPSRREGRRASKRSSLSHSDPQNDSRSHNQSQNHSASSSNPDITSLASDGSNALPKTSRPPPSGQLSRTPSVRSSKSTQSARSTLSSAFMDEIKHEVMVNYLYQQQCTRLWVSEGQGEVEGCIVRKARGQYITCPPPLIGSPFLKAMEGLNVQVSIDL